MESGRDQPPEHPVVPELREGDEAAGILHRLSRRVDGIRSWFHARQGGAQFWRGAVALVGLVVILVGIVLLAAPGPGWLVIFLGLGIWATEFAWARSLLKRTRRTVARWTAWVERHPRWLAGAVALIVLGVVAVGAWFLVGK